MYDDIEREFVSFIASASLGVRIYSKSLIHGEKFTLYVSGYFPLDRPVNIFTRTGRVNLMHFIAAGIYFD